MGVFKDGYGYGMELPNQQQGKEMPSAKCGDNYEKRHGKGHEHNLLAAATEKAETEVAEAAAAAAAVENFSVFFFCSLHQRFLLSADS